MEASIRRLVAMLSYRRPAWSRAEMRYIRRFIEPTGARPDAFGNYVLRIGDVPVLWSSHTDTVHRYDGRQKVHVHGGWASVRSPHNCLGADDTTGNWIMLEMIRARVPGLYVFHRAEELGCLGSYHIVRNAPELLEGIQIAIAFDRQGYDSIVTHQCGYRTASDTFAESWAAQMARHGIIMRPDPTGVFTDTEVYAGTIPECTNISVGYRNQHSPHEVQDLGFAAKLRNAMVRFDPSELVAARDPVGWTSDDWESWESWDDKDTSALLRYTSDVPDFRCDVCDRAGIDWHRCYSFAGGIACDRCFDELFSRD